MNKGIYYYLKKNKQGKINHYLFNKEKQWLHVDSIINDTC